MEITTKQYSDVGIDISKLDIKEFRNIRALSSYLLSVKDNETYRTSSKDNDYSFTGTNSFDEALDLIMYPNGEPPVEVNTRVESIENKIRNNLKKKGLLTSWIVEDYHYDVEGLELDIGKLIEGDPECYLQANKKYIDHYYELNVNIAVSGSKSTDTIIDAFCKVIAVVIALEKRGHKIKLIVSSISKNVSTDGRHSYLGTVVKGYDDYVNISTIARVIYPSFLRRLMFKIDEVMYGDKLESGYGQAVNTLKGVVTLDNSLEEEELLNSIVARYIAA